MGNIKPLGSEKLQGDDKLKRILELTYYGEKSKNAKKENSAEYVTESFNGYIYGIVKEGNSYYVKKGLNESSLDYIGGMFMKNKNKFSSYAEALKRLNLISGQETLTEEKKYVLKQKSSEEAPVSDEMPADEAPITDEPMGDETSAAEPDMGDDELPPVDDTVGDEEDMGDEAMDSEGKKSDYMAEIQKYAGKLGQELRDQKEKMESDDIKYVLNMIISAVDLDKLDDEDLEEIGSKFEREEEETEPEMGGEEGEEMPAEEPEMSGEELDETMSELEEFINTNFSDEEDMDEEDEFNPEEFSDLNEMGDEEEIEEIDLDEIKSEIAKNINTTLGKYFK